MMTNDQERRIFLAKLLKIPPALLGLDWRLVYYQDNKRKALHTTNVITA